MNYEGISVQYVDDGIFVKTLTGEEFIFRKDEIDFIYEFKNMEIAI